MTANEEKDKPSTVIIVGSGCSVGLGVPMMVGFLDSLLDKLATVPIGDYKNAREDLGTITRFIATAKGSAAYVRADLLNIEEMYGMADMNEDLTKKEETKNDADAAKKDDPAEVKKAFNRAIYYLAKKAGEDFIISSGNRFPKTSKDLEDLMRESQTEEPLHRNLGSHWTNLLAYLCLASYKDRNGRHPLFVQFNWDLALDRALVNWSKLNEQVIPRDGNVQYLPWYGANPDKYHNYSECPRLARPHGGLNWVDTEDVKFDKTSLENKCYLLGEDEKGTINDIWIDPNPVISATSEDSGDEWRNGDYMAIVPPTWRKQATRKAYEDQWSIIKEGLKHARRIFFLGYSLPKTDLYFRHFLALALAENNHLPKVYVLNPSIDQPGVVRDNYLDLFAPLAREGRLFGIEGRFGDPALFDLHRAVALAVPIKPE